MQLVRRVVVILIITVSLKPDSASASDPCTLIEGASESQDGKQVVFSQVDIEKKGEMDCKKDYAKYSASKYSTPKCVLAALTLIVSEIRHGEFWFWICNR